MLVDLSLRIDPKNAPSGNPLHALGHFGTHFDVVDKVFPLDSFRTKGRIVDISHISEREVEIDDLPDDIEPGSMVLLHTGHMGRLGYHDRHYQLRSAELSDAALSFLTDDRKVSLIGVDAAGIQKPKKHLAADVYCAERNIFVIENLVNVGELVNATDKDITIFTLPINFENMTGLPCRVLAEVV